MNVQQILDYMARFAPDGEPGDRARCGDTEFQVKEKANGELEIVVFQRVASVDMGEFAPSDGGE